MGRFAPERWARIAAPGFEAAAGYSRLIQRFYFYGVAAKFQLPQSAGDGLGESTRSLTIHTRELPDGGAGSGVAPA